jgi:4-diphosphocytidyl-2-C-methyl-D-erythritol kinase
MSGSGSGPAAVDATKRLAPVIRLAPAKLNLTLAVVGRRDDGYHALHSVMVPLGLADRLSVAVSSGDRDSLHVEGFDPGPPAENLVLRAFAAARAATERARLAAPPLAGRLEKAVPVAAGLAGGSSDAAAALDAALDAWAASDHVDDEQRVSIAASLGSDVPFFLVDGAALIEGRGERVTRLHGVTAHGGQPHAPPGVLLVTPPLAAHTAAVFAAWSDGAMGNPGVARRTSEHFASEFGSGLSVQALLERAGVLASANDLWPAAAAVIPGLVPLRRALTRTIHRPVGLSGSGPTLWALYPSVEEAAAAAELVRTAATSGELPIPGEGAPFIAATTIETHRGRTE